ncbi:hypothetical protein [Sediminicoccus rosea]|jgi:hypothetical protein|uniref:Uncharacterized protein n=1 Tax=Sediminicoccus rosea TaxID=1225128 RepID=A0ABZ0PJ99_9PROT|nr:hypothetical protein [Sediminicoccus rosea]WPB85552.1 hypothetical protein R9Z33_01465 [Sediminicoccus rosea]
MRKHLFTGLAAAAIGILPLGEASAQGNSYCNGMVQAASFYSTTHATPTRSTVSYFVIIQSMVEQSLQIEVTFRDTRNIVIPGGGGPHGRRLGPWGTSQPIQIGVATLANPSGTGGLNVPHDLAAGTTVTCRVLHRSGA